MPLPGETVSLGAPLPYDGAELQVMQSAAGYYIGYADDIGMPYSRESGYFASFEEADVALEDGYVPR